MSGPWEKYKKAEPAADGPWAKYKQPEAAAPVEESMNPFAGASVGENLSAAWDKVKDLGGRAMDSVQTFSESVNPLTPLARVAGNAVGAALDPTKDYDQFVEDTNADRAATQENSLPGSQLVGALTNPVNKIAGLLGVGASLGMSAANQGIEAVGLNSGESAGDIAENLGVETLLGGVGMGAGKVLSKLTDAQGARDAAINQVKKGFGATTAQMAEFGIKTDKMDDAAKLMLDSGLYNKPIQSKEGLYQALRSRMTKTGQDMDALADEYGTGIARGDLADMMNAQGADARKLGQSGLESAYQTKGNAFLSPETISAQKGVQKIDKALDKPQVDFDKLGAQQDGLGRKAEIKDIEQELLDKSNLRDDSLIRLLRQKRIDDGLASIDERGGYVGAKQAFNEAQQQNLLETRAGLQDVIDDGRADILSTTDLRKARIMEDSRAYPSQLSVDPDKAAIAKTLRQAEMDSIQDADAKVLYQKRKDEYATFAPAEEMTKKAAARDESKGLLNQLGNTRGRALGGGAGFLVAGPTGALVGQQIGAFGQDLLNKYGNQLAAYGFNKASKVLQNNTWAKALSDAGQRGGAAGVGTAHFLLTQRDPEYRKTYQDDQEASKDK